MRRSVSRFRRRAGVTPGPGAALANRLMKASQELHELQREQQAKRP
jgi:hypothetical protein